MTLTVILLSIFFWISWGYSATVQITTIPGDSVYINGTQVFPVSGSPVPTPTPTPTPIPQPDPGAVGSKTNPIPLQNFIPQTGGYGFDSRYGSGITIGRGKTIWFRIDPSVVIPGWPLRGFWIHMINFNPYTSRDNVMGLVLAVDKRTGVETSRGYLTGGQVAYPVMPFLVETFWLISLTENGTQDQPMTLFWQPF